MLRNVSSAVCFTFSYPTLLTHWHPTLLCLLPDPTASASTANTANAANAAKAIDKGIDKAINKYNTDDDSYQAGHRYGYLQNAS
jgi:hypothetical protein